MRHVEEVLRRWDPIGVARGDLAPADEYDSYAPHVVSLLSGGTSVTELAGHLEHVRTVTIGLAADPARDTKCAEELIRLWNGHGAGP